MPPQRSIEIPTLLRGVGEMARQLMERPDHLVDFNRLQEDASVVNQANFVEKLVQLSKMIYRFDHLCFSVNSLCIFFFFAFN